MNETVETETPQVDDRVIDRYWDGPNVFLYLVERPVL